MNCSSRGELYWSPAYVESCKDERGDAAWTQGHRPQSLPKPVVVTAQTYLASSLGYDCSVKDTISLYVPSPWLGNSWVHAGAAPRANSSHLTVQSSCVTHQFSVAV